MLSSTNPSCHSRFVIEVAVTINRSILKHRVEILSVDLASEDSRLMADTGIFVTVIITCRKV